MKRMFQMFVAAGLLAAHAVQAEVIKFDYRKAALTRDRNKKVSRAKAIPRAGKNRATPWHWMAKGQREALRAQRRAQGGPGIELVSGVWRPRA